MICVKLNAAFFLVWLLLDSNASQIPISRSIFVGDSGPPKTPFSSCVHGANEDDLLELLKDSISLKGEGQEGGDGRKLKFRPFENGNTLDRDPVADLSPKNTREI